MTKKCTLISSALLFFMSVFSVKSLAQSPVDSRISLSVDSVEVELIKVYDKTSSARVLNHGVLIGVNDGDTVNVMVNASYSHANADTDILIEVNFMLGGPQKNLYRLDTIVNYYHGKILPKQVFLTDFEIDTVKVYDGEVCGPIVRDEGSVVGSVAGDNLNVSLSLEYLDANVGMGKPVRVHPILGGGSSHNYFIQDTIIVASISPKALSIEGISIANSKEFDRTDSVNMISMGELVGVVPGDSVNHISWAQYQDSAIGYGKTVILHNQLNGVHSNNYQLEDEVDTLVADITPRKLYVKDISISSKVYDGRVDAHVLDSGTLDLTKVLIGDDVSHHIDSVYYTDKNAGNNKDVHIAQSLVGVDSELYIIDDTIIQANIIRKELMVCGVDVVLSKVYDGNNQANVINAGALIGMNEDDTVLLSAEAYYPQTDVDTSLTINVEFSLSGPQSACYSLDTTVVFNNGSIRPKELFLTGLVLARSKEYDGSVDGPMIINTGYLTGGILSSSVNIDSVKAYYYDANVGSDKPVLIRVYITPSNYYVRDTIFFAGITPKMLMIEGLEVDTVKEYDRTRIAAIDSIGSLTGVLPIDIDGVFHSVTAMYSDSLVGNNKPIVVDCCLHGSNVGNYQLLVINDTIFGRITPRQVFVQGIQASDKIYDGGCLVNIVNNGYLDTSQVIAGDEVSFIVDSAFFLDKMADTNKIVKVYLSLSGQDLSNYSLSDTTVRASIFPQILSINGINVNPKVYDGSVEANVFGDTLDGVIGDDLVDYNKFSEYDSPDVGIGKPVLVRYSLCGFDKGNYCLSSSSDTLFSDIYPKDVHVDSTKIVMSKIYDKSTNCEVLYNGVLSGICDRDTALGLVIPLCTATYADINVGDSIQVECVYSLDGSRSGNYIVSDTDYCFATITPYPLFASGAEVALVKEYDGNDSAFVKQNDTLRFVFEGDNVILRTYAKYCDAEVGSNKPITLCHSISGIDVGNYCKPIDTLYSNNGKIIEMTQFNEFESSGELYQLNSSSFCQGDTCVLSYQIKQGEPMLIRILYSEEAQQFGFCNTEWMPISDNATVSLGIPMQVLGGKFSFQIDFQNEAEKIASITNIPLVVNLSNHYLRQTFEDVLSIDNSGRLDSLPGRFTRFQWFHNGEKVDGAELPYIRERGGLTGEYSVRVNESSIDEFMVCPMRDFIKPSTKAIYALPNVVRTKTQIKLQGFEDGQKHILQVFDFNGALVRTLEFIGLETFVDCSALPNGAYLFYVDGVSAKIIRQ